MEEDFYGIIKLISGEEVFAKICPFDDGDDDTLLMLDSPVTMETIVVRQLGMTTIKVSPWIKMSDEDLFIIKMDKIITVTEVSDKDLIKMHIKYVKDKNRKSNKTKLSEKMGYLSSIADARISLEKLYKSNN
jgi:hypothetical protein